MNPTQDTLDLVKGALRSPDDRISKTISTGTGLVAFDLQAPAKNLYPFVTPIRNVDPAGRRRHRHRDQLAPGRRRSSAPASTRWAGCPEGQRSGQMSYSTATKSATFVTIGEEDAATYEAISAGRYFEDIQARMTFRLLQKMMLKEEMAILAGNASCSSARRRHRRCRPRARARRFRRRPISSRSSALTLEGYQNSSLPRGSRRPRPITGADGHTFTLSAARRTSAPRPARR